MSLLLRRAALEELPVIVGLINRSYRSAGPKAGWASEAAYIEGDRTSLMALTADVVGKPNAALLVAELSEQGPIQACVWLEQVGAEEWYLGSLTIDPMLQNSGLGRRLLEAAEDWARAQGANRIAMKVVNVRDALIAWYERRGYRLTGETAAFPYGDNRFGRPLRDDLAFVVLEKMLGSGRS